ncbi:MAG: LuxR C-terminal-related transcriptional regulator [Dehalococcoidia bacterium]|nr:LuxR C-terminal-related transcriptional regulator [Dehalococcoidia bacterium]
MTTDPETMLPSGGIVEGFSPKACGPFWDAELLIPDFIKFADLARRVDPVATLSDATDGELSRSPRYRDMYAPLGASDEMRIVFMSGSSCLAVAAFLRPAGAGPFTSEELASCRELTSVATTALRRALGRLVHEAISQPPVVVVLDGDDRIVDITEGGREVMEDLRTQDIDELPLPGVVRVACARARWSGNGGTLTTRVRGQSGRWLRLHVSPLEGTSGSVAVTVETARPHDLIPILLESYGLTERETEVVLLLCRGLSSKDIADELLISPHTVRDYVKAIYEKAEVNSRGELIANLFTGHVLERFHSTVMHVA